MYACIDLVRFTSLEIAVSLKMVQLEPKYVGECMEEEYIYIYSWWLTNI